MNSQRQIFFQTRKQESDTNSTANKKRSKMNSKNAGKARKNEIEI